jgi:hypothetical protein
MSREGDHIMETGTPFVVGLTVVLAASALSACGGTTEPARTSGSGVASTGSVPGSSGAAATAGSAGTGGSTDTGSTPSSRGTAETGGACSKCNPVLEQCFNNLFCVAKLVSIKGDYGIDATEVTRDHYAAWLGTNPSTSAPPGYCSWNADFHASLDFHGRELD